MKNFRKRIALLLALCTVFTSVAAGPLTAYASENVREYGGDGYRIICEVINEWQGGQQVSVTIVNMGTEPIENWGLQADICGTIGTIWNASAQYDAKSGKTVIRNNQYNAQIPVDGQISFGYTQYGDGFYTSKEMILTQQKREVSEGYEICCNITNDWGTGFQGTLTIVNTKEEPIENWRLELCSSVELGSVWGAECAAQEERLVLTACGWNGVIAAGGSVTIGFTGVKDENTEICFSDYVLTEVVTYPKTGSTATPGGTEKPGETPTEKPTVETTEAIDYTLDTDEDGLPDWLEEELGCDTENPDTDGDGLPDGYEVFLLGTNPAMADSDDNGVLDGDEDTDKDGLTDYEEYEIGSNPQNKDTDKDGLEDYAEIHTYGTALLLQDTDEDGLTDYEEVILGLNPNGESTDGILDSKQKLYQIIRTQEECLLPINENCEEYQLSIEITASGYAPNNLKASQSPYAKAVKNPSMVGACVQIQYSDFYEYEGMRLQFHMSEEEIASRNPVYGDYTDEFDGILRYQVFRYDESAGRLLPVPTQMDVEHDIVFADVTDEGTYCVMDLEEWLAGLGFDITEELPEQDETFDIETYSVFSARDALEEADSFKVETDFSEIYQNIRSAKELSRAVPYSLNRDGILYADKQYRTADVVFLIQGYGYNGNNTVFQNEIDAIRTYAKEAYVMVPDLRVRILFTRPNERELDSGWIRNCEELNQVLDGLKFDSSVRDNGDMSRCLNKAMNFGYRYKSLPFVIWVMSGEVTLDSKYQYWNPEEMLYETGVAPAIIGELPEFRQGMNLLWSILMSMQPPTQMLFQCSGMIMKN